MSDSIFQGSLFSTDFVNDAISRLPEWQALDEATVDAFGDDLRRLYAVFPVAGKPNETQTEDDLIWPVLTRLGWADALRQQNLTLRGRDDVPDGLLFENARTKARANRQPEEWKRYEFGLALVESKRWTRSLDWESRSRDQDRAPPAAQMLRYLRRADDITGGKLRWGILTNGQRWRLYYQGARSVSEQFFDLDLPTILGVPGFDGGLFAPDATTRAHWLRVFILVFRREAFIPGADQRTFHQRAVAEGRLYEERVAGNLSDMVFGNVFPTLAQAIAAAAPTAPLSEVRDAALILLYRLLFILYAEDRDLLPVKDDRYAQYGLRQLRHEIGERKDRDRAFSETAGRYWSIVEVLCRAIDEGDASIGLPPYNGGLFDPESTPLLGEVRLGDAAMANIIDILSFERTEEGRKYINYRDLSVQQLGSIYERLLENEVTREAGQIHVRPNIFARRGSGSYYTPDDLVNLIIRETVDPIIDGYLEAFAERSRELEHEEGDEFIRMSRLSTLDPAEKILKLKICDPAMGSGHFLVSLTDYIADRAIAAISEAEAEAPWTHYISPVTDAVRRIRTRIYQNVKDGNWSLDEDQLDDRHIIRRMVLKRCIYGVDKNPMAVELAKVSLWLHTFTVGAPLSFLDHHLRCGDSLFGAWVRKGVDRASQLGAPLFLHEPISKALQAAAKMQFVEGLTDAEIAEAHLSRTVYEEVREMTAPLDALLSLIHALNWLDLRGQENIVALQAFFSGQFGDPVLIAMGKAPVATERAEAVRFAEILSGARELIAEERFFNWQVIFPGVWSEWEQDRLFGGFDAVIGNPPWDRMKLQQVEWFAARRREIALAQRAADRSRMIAALERAGDPLAADYARAAARAETGVRVAQRGGDYPLLSGGDVNLYSLFVERAMTLLKPEGIMGLLTPSGIASDKTAAPFFKGVATTGRLKALYDFENRRTRYGLEPFFPDVDSRFKFLAFIASPSPVSKSARCAFFLQAVLELDDPDRCFPLTAQDFARVNPNTGTAPIFRTRRDAALTTAIYGRLPVLVDRAGGGEVRTWPVRYVRMFDMTNDSGLFVTREELEEREKAYPLGGNRYKSAKGEFVPLYEGKMVQAFDHRAASVVVNPANQHRPAQPMPATCAQHCNPDWLPDPQFWVDASHSEIIDSSYSLAFKDVTAPTNMRSMIAAMIPAAGVGNTLPILHTENDGHSLSAFASTYILANFNAMIFDYVARQKIQGQHLNWYIVEQLPVVPPETYETIRFGKKTAADIIRAAVLELTYTAHDMAPFARDLGYVAKTGKVRLPFRWDKERRLKLRAKLDALYFHLYGVTDRDDVRYVFSTFPIVEREEMALYNRYRSRELCLAWINAFAAGDPDADIDL